MYICSCHLSQSWKYNNRLLRAFNTRYTTDNNLGKKRSDGVAMIEKEGKIRSQRLGLRYKMHKQEKLERQENNMSADTIDGDSLLLLLRDAIVQHSPLKDIKLILSCKEININRGVRRGLRPLHYAVFENDLECVRLLIEDHNADVNVLDEAGYSPLHLASKYGFIDIMHILIDHGSLINFHNAVDNSQTRSLITPYYDVMTEPLSLCLENNHIECARLLVFSGANVNQQYFLGYEINLLPYENLHALELILKHGANSNALSRSGITPLIKACREGNIGAVILLCRYGANVNYVTRKFRQRNAIITAIELKQCDIVEQLLAYGGFVNKHPDLCNSPLELAIRKDHIDTVRLLIGRLNRFLIVQKYLFYQIAFSFSFWCRYK